MATYTEPKTLGFMAIINSFYTQFWVYKCSFLLWQFIQRIFNVPFTGIKRVNFIIALLQVAYPSL